MPFNFTQSGHRAFEQSPGRQRNTHSGSVVSGFRRRTAFNGLAGFYFSPTSGPSPAAPADVTVTDGNVGGRITQLHPEDYPGTFVSVSQSNAGATTYGTPADFQGIPWTLGQPFRIRIRTWGLAPLCNPWQPPIELQFTVGPFNATIFDATTRYQFRIGSTPFSTAPHGIDVSLNAVWPPDGLGSGDPKGLWRFDRIITAYGTITNAAITNRSWDIVYRGVSVPADAFGNHRNGLSADENFPFAISPFIWMEPNSTFTNPAPPFSVAQIPLAEREQAAHLFDWRDQPFANPALQPAVEWCSNGVAAYLIDYAEVPAVLPIEYVDLVMEQVSQIRP